MKLKVIVHHDHDGLWAEVPAVPGCATQAETMDDLLVNLREAIEGCLSVEISDEMLASGSVIEIAVSRQTRQRHSSLGFASFMKAWNVRKFGIAAATMRERMVRHKSTVTREERTTVPKAMTEFQGVERDPSYWEIVDGAPRVATEEPRFFRWFGTIKVGHGSTVEDVRRARALRGR